MSYKTGTSMGGSTENINSIKSVKSNCSTCFHRRKDKTSKQFYCDYYKSFSINKTKCIRYSERVTKVKDSTTKELAKKTKKMTKAERLESYKRGLVDTTWIKNV